MPLRLEDGWNMLQLDLADLVRKAYGRNCWFFMYTGSMVVWSAWEQCVIVTPYYTLLVPPTTPYYVVLLEPSPPNTGTQYTETLRVQVHASCHMRRVFFSDKAYREEELPPEFRLYVPS